VAVQTIGEVDQPILYCSLEQNIGLATPPVGFSLLVHFQGKPAQMATALRNEIHSLDPGLAVFGARGSVRYDARCFSFKPLDHVSLLTVDGRVTCRMLLGPRQHAMLTDPAWESGGADLVYRRHRYYLHVTQSREAERRAQIATRALYESEQRYRLIAEAIPQFVWLDSAAGRSNYANTRSLEYTGLSAQEHAGFGCEAVVHPAVRARLQQDSPHHLATAAVYPT